MHSAQHSSNTSSRGHGTSAKLTIRKVSCTIVYCRMIAGTLGSGPTSTQTPSSAASRGSSSSSSMLDTPALANHKRKGSFGTPTHRHKASNGSRDFNAPDMIVPSVPRAEMVLTTPVVQQRIHSEPLTDLLFSQYAVYTADACGQVGISFLSCCLPSWRSRFWHLQPAWLHGCILFLL